MSRDLTPTQALERIKRRLDARASTKYGNASGWVSAMEDQLRYIQELCHEVLDAVLQDQRSAP